MAGVADGFKLAGDLTKGCAGCALAGVLGVLALAFLWVLATA